MSSDTKTAIVDEVTTLRRHLEAKHAVSGSDSQICRVTDLS